ncbi:response regulator transcription factor [Paractinoplanes toevensis]|uniref:HTH luxR-type domain-containing protein n=1 Tax=Paractinoplanes toevensis TaxID=571911 RepID=A0A919W1W2_9ACTN|nr:LuxR C-terminal-related transcriptional regulator [Actinoplanes toevensis]GIM88865.1 hypothetical protein Ato02nite_006580 [Actinoplanes toevensis]
MTGYNVRERVYVTPAQQEVLRLLAEGDTDQEIAATLGVSKGTVETHIKALRWALTACNRTHVVARGYQEGLLPTDRKVTS